MAGIKDGMAGGLSLDKKSSEGLGLNEEEFISINDSMSVGLNYKDIQTEGFYITPVWKWMIEDISALEALIPVLYKLKEEVPDGNQRSNFGGWQSPDDLHLRPEFKEFTQMLLNIAEVQIHNHPWECIGLWAGINPPGAGNNVHMHDGVLSGTVWLQCDSEKSGGLIFVDPRIRSEMSGQRGSFLFETNNRGYHPVVGIGVMFPSWLEHYVMENKDDKDRISLSFNLV